MRIISGIVAVAAVASWSCGGTGTSSPAQGAVEGPAAQGGTCTGLIPANAAMCPNADAGLASDAPRTLIETCTCDASCRAITACSYACISGYVLRGGACQPVTPPAHVQVSDNGDGTVTVTDDNGHAVWLKSAGCTGPVPWFDASAWIAGLADGACGLRDGSIPGEWLLPTQIELMDLAAALHSAAYEAAGSPFTDVSASGYWSSFTTCLNVFGVVEMSSGQYSDKSADLSFSVWPVRH